MSGQDGTDASPGARVRRLAHGWCMLAAASALLYAVVFIAIPASNRLPLLAPAVQYLLDSGIEVTALYYTGVEKTADAERAIHDAVKGPGDRRR